MKIKSDKYVNSLIVCLLFYTNVITAQPKMMMGIDQSPPYNFKDENGQFRGLLVDVIEQLANQSDISIEYILCPWARCVSLVESGQIDLLAGLSKTVEREKHLHFIEPAIFSQQTTFGFYTLDPAIKIGNYDDLASLVIGRLRGSKHFQKFDEDDQLITVDTPNIATLFSLLLNGRIDTFIHANETVLPYLTKFDPNNTIGKTQFSHTSQANGFIVLSKKSAYRKHLPLISEQLNVMKKQGAFDVLHQ